MSATVTTQDTLLSPLEAVMTALPTPKANTCPPRTVATDVLLDVQVTDEFAPSDASPVIFTFVV